MYCQFFGGPVDGLEKEVPGARIGDGWSVICEVTITPKIFFVGAPEPDLTLPPIARYRLVDEHKMQYEGMQQ